MSELPAPRALQQPHPPREFQGTASFLDPAALRKAAIEPIDGGIVILTPIVVAELVSGTTRERDRREISALVAELPLHETPLAHWIEDLGVSTGWDPNISPLPDEDCP